MSRQRSLSYLQNSQVAPPDFDFDDEPGLLPLIDSVRRPSTAEAPPDTVKCTPQPLQALLSTRDAAALFDRDPRTLHRWRQRGLLRAVRVGRALFYVLADLDALIAGRLTSAIQRDSEPAHSSGLSLEKAGHSNSHNPLIYNE